MWTGKFVVKSFVQLSREFESLKKYEYRAFENSVESLLNDLDPIASAKGYDVLCWSVVPTHDRSPHVSVMFTFKSRS